MKHFITTLILFFIISFHVIADCSNAISNGDDTYRYARKAYLESSFEDAQDYARQAKNASETAKSAAKACHCTKAVNSFDEAYINSLRAYNASDLSELNDYARKAMKEAEIGRDNSKICD